MSETVGHVERKPAQPADGRASDAAAGGPGVSAPQPRPAAHARIAWLVALLLVVGFIGALTSLALQSRDGASFDLHGWRDGSLGRSVDRAIDVPYAHTLHRWQAAARYRFFGDLGTQVREGCPGWLFYADGLQAPVQPGFDPVMRADGGDALTDARIATLHQYANVLHGMGIQLVVVTVPDKARVETEALCGLRQDTRMTQRLNAWNRALNASGVAHVELLPVLQAARPAFYRTDVHWNARGAQAAAQTIGAAVLPLLGGERGKTAFTHATAPEQPRIGDLLKLANLDDVSDFWRPAPDLVSRERLHAQQSGGLLDDGPAAQVLLAGSSFSRRSAFAGRLGEQLGSQVWNVSLDDGRFDRALKSVWNDRANWPKSVRVVIWEMSEDALSMPVDTNAQKD